MRDESHVDDGFDMTPMIDVVMLLTNERRLPYEESIRTPLELPRQDGQQIEDANNPGDIVVDLLADGSVRLEGETVSMDVFISGVRAEVLHGTPDLEVLIRPDRSGSAAHLNRLCKQLSEAGVRAYRIATTPIERGAR